MRSLLLSPIVDADGKVIGLVELVNKDADHEGLDQRQGQPGCARLPGAKGSRESGAEDEEDAVYTRPHGLRRRNSVCGFSRDDERLLRMLCAHCCIFLKHLEAGD